MSQQTELKACAHCIGTGTCRTGKEEASCANCANRWWFYKYEPAHGLVCSICKGKGYNEPIAFRLIHRTGPILAICVVVTALFYIVWLGRENHFSEVLAFLGPLTGAVTGFYFGSDKK